MPKSRYPKRRLPDRPGFKKIDRRWPEHYHLDLGDGHYLEFSVGGVADEDGIVRDKTTEGFVGAVVYHHKDDNPRGYCSGGIRFDVPWQREHGQKVLWQVQSWDPLTCSPSLLCHCGDHGFIRDGKWVRA